MPLSRIRLLGSLSSPYAPPVDLRQSPRLAAVIPRGADVLVELALAGPAGGLPLTVYESLTCVLAPLYQGRFPPPNEDYVPLAAHTLPGAAALPPVDPAAYAALTAGPQITFTLPAASTAAIRLSAVWLAISGLTSAGQRVTLVAGRVSVAQTGMPLQPQEPLDLYLTQAQSDIRYLRGIMPGANYRVSGEILQLREHAPAPGWRTVWLADGALQVGALIPAGEEAEPPAPITAGSNFRVPIGGGLQLREVGPVSGWRTVFLENGAFTVGALQPDPPESPVQPEVGVE